MIDSKKLWDSVLAEIELNVSKANFSTWFKDTNIAKNEEGVIHIAVPNTFVKDWLVNKYGKFILKILRDLNDSVRGVEFIVSRDSGKKIESQQENQLKNLVFSGSQLPLQELYINKEDNLNPRYSFENFVVGPFNELAHAAAQAVIKNPGGVYNPFFVYGDTGRGKTHLIQAIGNHIKTNHPNKKVYYITSEQFAVDYMNSIPQGKANVFKEKYRKYDVLIMDDTQFFSKTEKTQEELFHLFNTFHDNNKQIVFSSDKHPNYIPNLEERIKSRFSQGMIVDIQNLDHESKVAILKAKSAQQNISLPQEIVDYLASSIESNVREIEGVLNSIICQTQLKNKELTLVEVKNLLKNNTKPKKNASIKDIVKTVADFYNIEEGSIYDKTRRKEVVKPRQLIMYILREDFNISFPSIGEKLGGRDHTTVIHSYEKVKKDLKTDHQLEQHLNEIRTMI